MKVLLLLTAIFATTTMVYGGTLELADNILRTMRKCGKKHHLNLNDVQMALRKGQLPTSEGGKCFVSCTLEEFGLVKDKTFLVEGSYALNAKRFRNPEELKRANEVTDKCAKEFDAGEYENECDFGIAVANCGIQNSRSVGIISSDLW